MVERAVVVVGAKVGVGVELEDRQVGILFGVSAEGTDADGVLPAEQHDKLIGSKVRADAGVYGLDHPGRILHPLDRPVGVDPDAVGLPFGLDVVPLEVDGGFDQSGRAFVHTDPGAGLVEGDRQHDHAGSLGRVKTSGKKPKFQSMEAITRK